LVGRKERAIAKNFGSEGITEKNEAQRKRKRKLASQKIQHGKSRVTIVSKGGLEINRKKEKHCGGKGMAEKGKRSISVDQNGVGREGARRATGKVTKRRYRSRDSGDLGIQGNSRRLIKRKMNGRENGRGKKEKKSKKFKRTNTKRRLQSPRRQEGAQGTEKDEKGEKNKKGEGKGKKKRGRVLE